MQHVCGRAERQIIYLFLFQLPEEISPRRECWDKVMPGEKETLELPQLDRGGDRWGEGERLPKEGRGMER